MTRSMTELQQALQSFDWKVRAQAADKLGELGEKAVPALLKALGDESQFVRMAAARALGRAGDSAAVSALIQALSDPIFMVRQSALWALGEIGDPSAIPALQPLVSDATMYAERTLTVSKLAEIALARIEAKSEATQAVASGTAAEEATGVLSPEERKAKREAALARKRAAAGIASEATTANESGVLSPEERRAKREAALARKAARQQGEGS